MALEITNLEMFLTEGGAKLKLCLPKQFRISFFLQCNGTTGFSSRQVGKLKSGRKQSLWLTAWGDLTFLRIFFTLG